MNSLPPVLPEPPTLGDREPLAIGNAVIFLISLGMTIVATVANVRSHPEEWMVGVNAVMAALTLAIPVITWIVRGKVYSPATAATLKSDLVQATNGRAEGI